MSGQNTSSAVMQQRREPDDSLEDFPTQPWGTRALVVQVVGPAVGGVAALKRFIVWEPTCNRGHMSGPLGEVFGEVWASDILDYGLAGAFQHDFLLPVMPAPMTWAGCERPDWVVANPPFRLAEQFIHRARAVARIGVAMIVRTGFLEGVGRYNDLFSRTPPTIIAQFTERVPMVKGRLTAKGSTATAYCWLVWIAGMAPQPFQWIAPCRKSLERPGDYPPVSEPGPSIEPATLLPEV
jgi:hypothetical protein